MSTIQVELQGFDTFRELYELDPTFAVMYQKLNEGVENGEYLLVDGFLFKGNQLCVPTSSLYKKIIQELHCKGHVG